MAGAAAKGADVAEAPETPIVGVNAGMGLLRCGRLVPKLPADVFDVARLRPAKLVAPPPDELLAASRSVEPWELKLLMLGLKLPAVPGRSAPGAAGSERA